MSMALFLHKREDFGVGCMYVTLKCVCVLGEGGGGGGEGVLKIHQYAEPCV